MKVKENRIGNYVIERKTTLRRKMSKFTTRRVSKGRLEWPASIGNDQC